jgi:hypothetical protein
MVSSKLSHFVWAALTVGLVSLAGFAIGLRPVNAAEPVVELDPSPLHLAQGISTDVDIWVRGLDGVSGLTSYSLTLEFSPDVLTIDGVEGGDSPFDEIPAFNIDNPAGNVSITAVGSGGGITGDQRIATVKLTALEKLQGKSFLKFADVELNDSDDSPISPAVVSDAEVSVGDAVVRVGSGVIPVGGSGTFPVTVAFNPESGLAGYSLAIEYDPSIVKIEQLLHGDTPFGGTPVSHIFEAEGLVNVVGFHGSRPGPRGRTLVLKIELTGLAEGSSPLKVTVRDLVDAVDNDSWPALAIDGRVRVVDPASFVHPPEEEILATPAPIGTPVPVEPPIRANISPLVGVEIVSANGNLGLRIPAGAVSHTGFVELAALPSDVVPPPPSGATLTFTALITLLDSDGNPTVDAPLSRDATITMRLTAEQLQTTPPDEILIQRYEPLLGQWIQLPTEVDVENLVATAFVNRFSIFGLILGQKRVPALLLAAPPNTTPKSESTAPAAALPVTSDAAEAATSIATPIPTSAPSAAPITTPPTAPTESASSDAKFPRDLLARPTWMLALAAAVVLALAGSGVFLAVHARR